MLCGAFQVIVVNCCALQDIVGISGHYGALQDIVEHVVAGHCWALWGIQAYCVALQGIMALCWALQIIILPNRPVFYGTVTLTRGKSQHPASSPWWCIAGRYGTLLGIADDHISQPSRVLRDSHAKKGKILAPHIKSRPPNKANMKVLIHQSFVSQLQGGH